MKDQEKKINYVMAMLAAGRVKPTVGPMIGEQSLVANDEINVSDEY